VSRFGFIQDHSSAFSVKRLCQVLGLARSSYYAWKKAREARAERARRDAELTEAIRAIHKQDPAYGEPRITAELQEMGYEVNHKRVERLMREAGIEGLHLRKKVRTTVPAPPTSQYRTFSNATSPPPHPTAATSVTSPTCPWKGADSCTWPPSSTCTRAVWWAGPSPSTCARP
jgi:transposase InsO family protein